MLTAETYVPACDPPDQYDKAIQGILKSKDIRVRIRQAWATPNLSLVGCLFKFCVPGQHSIWISQHCGYGCLTMVKAGISPAFTKELTAAIRADDRLPTVPKAITPDHLPVFAEWQRRMDEMFKDQVPVHRDK